MTRKLFEELNKNIIRVALENPEIERALLELNKLKERYKVKREECMKKPAFLNLVLRC